MLKDIFKSINSKEWWFATFISICLILVTSAPAVYGYLITPENHIFTAIHFVSLDDWFVYYSFINQGASGEFLFRDLFSPVDHIPVFRPFWLAVGLMAGLFNLAIPLAFHLARVILIPVFVFLAYIFLAYIFSEKIKRKVSLVFLSVSSGMGTAFIHRLVTTPENYAYGSFRWPMDLWVPDINTFLTLFTSPHFIGATILILLIFFLTVLYSEKTNYFYPVASGLAGLLLFSFHPFQVIKVYAVMAVFFLILIWRKKKILWPLIWYYAIFALISSPSILYYLWLLQVDWLTVQRAAQNINPTAPLHLLIFSLGGLFFLAVLSFYQLFRNNKLKDNKYLFLVVWAFVQFVILYAPVNYQRRLALGIHIPFAILSALYLFHLYQLKKTLFKKNVASFLVLGGLIFLPSTLFALSADLMVFNQQHKLSYVTQGEYNGYLWLKRYAAEESIVFSDVKTGLILSAYSLRTSYVSHPVETPFYREIKKEPEWFFAQNRPEKEEINFLKDRDIDYIYYGPKEVGLGGFYNPDTKNYLQEVYTSADTKIYQVL